MKMLWDDEFFYVAADMEEPDLWGTLTARDSVIFHDNDFEVFVDPDGDTPTTSSRSTRWHTVGPDADQAYRDGGRAIDAWDIAGLKAGIDLRGTINRPGDRDDGWSVEIGMPWRMLREAAPNSKPPQPGDRWRVNFSRVEWQTDVRRPLRETAEARLEGSVAREQLGLSPCKAPSTCTCPNAGVSSSFLALRWVVAASRSWTTRTKASSGRSAGCIIVSGRFVRRPAATRRRCLSST